MYYVTLRPGAVIFFSIFNNREYIVDPNMSFECAFDPYMRYVALMQIVVCQL